MPWLDVLNTFDGIYVSWDPAMWHKTLNYHGCVASDLSLSFFALSRSRKWKIENGETCKSDAVT